MTVVRFANEAEKPLNLIVEPWATTVSIPAGSKFAVHYPAPVDRPDTSFAEIREGLVTFWCGGDTFEVEVDGKQVLT